MLRFICPHHSGPIGRDPYSKSQHISLEHIENAHAAKDFNLSDMGFYTGYNIILPPEGPWVQTRALGEMTCAAVGHNFDTVHIAFLGNFTKQQNGLPIELPTSTQKLDFIDICMRLLRKDYSKFVVKPGTEFDLHVSRILPHRILQPNHTSCYGDFLSDTWARDLIAERMRGQLDLAVKLLYLYQKLLILIKQSSYGSSGEKSCSGNI